jgi:hypothetical protein
MHGWGRTRQRSLSELQRGVKTPAVSVECFSRGGLPTPDWHIALLTRHAYLTDASFRHTPLTPDMRKGRSPFQAQTYFYLDCVTFLALFEWSRLGPPLVSLAFVRVESL